MFKMIDISGQKFGRLIAIDKVGRTKNRSTLWRCICECGNETITPIYRLKGGRTKSCGCLKIELSIKRLEENTLSGVDHPAWKGNNVSYSRLHSWLRYHLTKTGVCTKCEKEVGATGMSGTQWANISGQYRRDFSDYVELCVSCHTKMDRGKE